MLRHGNGHQAGGAGRYKKWFKADQAGRPLVKPVRSYILCTTPRSGSTLLCGLMAAVGTCGHPESYVHSDTRGGWLAAHGLNEADFAVSLDAVAAALHAVLLAGTRGTDVFGLRLQGAYLPFFLSQLRAVTPDAPSDVARIDATFGVTQYIHLVREERLLQAISREMAVQSGLWHRAADGSEMERLSVPQEPVYDRAAIVRHMAEAEQLDARWRAWFNAQSIVPLVIRYSDLAADPRATLARVLRVLGQDETLAEGVYPKVSKLSDARNRDWAARFVAGN